MMIYHTFSSSSCGIMNDIVIDGLQIPDDLTKLAKENVKCKIIN